MPESNKLEKLRKDLDKRGNGIQLVDIIMGNSLPTELSRPKQKYWDDMFGTRLDKYGVYQVEVLKTADQQEGETGNIHTQQPSNRIAFLILQPVGSMEPSFVIVREQTEKLSGTPHLTAENETQATSDQTLPASENRTNEHGIRKLTLDFEGIPFADEDD